MLVFKHIYKKFIRGLIATRPIGFLIYLYILTVFLTSKRSIIYAKNFDTKKFQNTSSVAAFWHGRMMLMYFLKPKNKKHNIFISAHADGRIIGNVSSFFNVNVIWGSSNKNPMGSIKQIFKVLQKKECLSITPDGPRGPAFEINSNIVKIASKYGLYVIPVTYSASRKKVFSSWDKFMLPLPFGEIIFIYGAPIKVPHKVTSSEVEQINARIKNELDSISSKADKLVKI